MLSLERKKNKVFSRAFYDSYASICLLLGDVV